MTSDGRTRLAGGITATVLVALAVIWEPAIGIFRQTVMLNELFLGVLGLVTAAAALGLLLSWKVLPSSPKEGLARAIRTVAAVELVLLLFVWGALLTTRESWQEQPVSRTGILRLER